MDAGDREELPMKGVTGGIGILAGGMALLAAGVVGSGQSKDAGVERAYVDGKGSVHIVEGGGTDIAVAKEKDQVGSEQVKVAEDKKTGGWAVDSERCRSIHW